MHPCSQKTQQRQRLQGKRSLQKCWPLASIGYDSQLQPRSCSGAPGEHLVPGAGSHPSSSCGPDCCFQEKHFSSHHFYDYKVSSLAMELIISFSLEDGCSCPVSLEIFMGRDSSACWDSCPPGGYQVGWTREELTGLVLEGGSLAQGVEPAQSHFWGLLPALQLTTLCCSGQVTSLLSASVSHLKGQGNHGAWSRFVSRL